MTPEERINAARGYKAYIPFSNLSTDSWRDKSRALHNEHVSIEAKQHAEQMLRMLNEEEARQQLHEEGEHQPYHRHQRRSPVGERPSSPQEVINAARGYKAYVAYHTSDK